MCLSKDDLIKMDYIPKLNEVSLKTIADFYVEYLTNKSYKFVVRPHRKTEDMQMEIKFFKENLPHLLGVQKIPNSNTYKYKGETGFNNIMNESITIESLKNLDRGLRPARKDRIFPQIETRIIHFF